MYQVQVILDEQPVEKEPVHATTADGPTLGQAIADRQSVLLVQRIGSGDEGALAELIEAHGSMLYRLIGRLTAWSSDRDDILQEVLIKVWSQAGKFRGGSVAAWLRRITVNQCHNNFRSLGVVRRLMRRLRLDAEKTVEVCEPSDDARDASEMTRLALAGLRPADRTLIVLYYLEELSIEEIATTLEVTPETLHVRLHRARERMRNLLEPHVEC